MSSFLDSLSTALSKLVEFKIFVLLGADTTLIMDDLEHNSRGSRSQQLANGHAHDVSDHSDDRPSPTAVTLPLSPDVAIESKGFRPNSQASNQSSDGSGDHSSLSDKTGALSISAITELISSVAVDSKSNLAGMIMQMSQNKKQEKYAKKASTKHGQGGSIPRNSDQKSGIGVSRNSQAKTTQNQGVSTTKPSSGMRATGNGSLMSLDNKNRIPAAKQSSETTGKQKDLKTNRDSRGGTNSKKVSTPDQETVRKPADGVGHKNSQPAARTCQTLPASQTSSNRRSVGIDGVSKQQQSVGGPSKSTKPQTEQRSSSQRLSGIPSRVGSARTAPPKTGNSQPRNASHTSVPNQPEMAKQTRSENTDRLSKTDQGQPRSKSSDTKATSKQEILKPSSAQDPKPADSQRRRSAKPTNVKLVQNVPAEAEDFNREKLLVEDINFRSPRLSTIPSRSNRFSLESSDNNLNGFDDCEEHTPVKKSPIVNISRQAVKHTNQEPRNSVSHASLAREQKYNVLTPDDQTFEAGRKRMSSTPNIAGHEGSTMCGTHSISHISPSPRDRVTFFPSAEATLASDNSDKSTPSSNGDRPKAALRYAFQQSTPKPDARPAGHGYFQSQKPTDFQRNALSVPVDVSPNVSQCSQLSQYPVDTTGLYPTHQISPRSAHPAKYDLQLASTAPARGHMSTRTGENSFKLL